MISWHDVWSGGWDAAKLFLAALLCVTIVGIAIGILYMFIVFVSLIFVVIKDAFFVIKDAFFGSRKLKEKK